MSRFPIVWRFLAVGLLWGSSFVWVSHALNEMSWEFLTWGRGIVGGVTLALLVLIQRPKSGTVVWPRSVRLWLHFAVIGVLLAVIPNMFWAIAMQSTSASLASIYNATVPIFTAILAGLIFRIDTLGRAQWLGVVCGIVGVIVVIGPWEATLSGSVESQFACLIAAASAAAAFVYQRKFLAGSSLHPTTSAAMLAIGSALVSLASTPLWASWPMDASPTAWFSIVWLGALVGGLAYVWNSRVIDAWGATGASMVTYLSPVIGVTLGMSLLGDTLTWHAPIGGLLIFLGIAIGQRSPRTSKQPPELRQESR